MSARILLLGCTVCAALAARAQNLGIGQNGIRLNDSQSVLAPEALRADQELKMARLPVSEGPAVFYLTYGTSGRGGPYPLSDGTVIGNPPTAYTLKRFDYGNYFTLHPASGTNVSYGPFAATNGAPVIIGERIMSVLRFPPKLQVSLSHPDKISQAPLIGIAPYDEKLRQALYGLRAKFLALANRVDYENADVELEGVPKIYNRATGNTFSPVIKKSARDKQNTLKGAERSAVRFLESLMGEAFRIRSQAITEGSTYHFGMPPGDYVICAMQKVKDAQAQGAAGSATAIWWTPFHFDGEHPLALNLTDANAVTWREVFTLERP